MYLLLYCYGYHQFPHGWYVDINIYDMMFNKGITISPPSQHHGVAFAALTALINYLFGRLGKRRVTATVDARNFSSIYLFRRLQFRQEGHFIENIYFKGEWGSEFQFAILQSEWLALKSET